MKQQFALISALVSTTAAFAATPDLTMTFLATKAAPIKAGASVFAGQRQVYESRHADRMVVIVKEPAACGVRPSAAGMSLHQDSLQLNYRTVKSAASGSAACESTAIFSIKGLPDRRLEVVADSLSIAPALAQEPIASSLPMGFVAVPAAQRPTPVHHEVRYARHGDQLTAVVTDPASCGARAVDPSADWRGSTLHLQYRVAAPAAGETPCAAVAVFTLKDSSAPGALVVADATLTAPSHATTTSLGSFSAQAPSMTFLAAPAIHSAWNGAALRSVVQARNGSTMNVVVREPAACGQRPQSASFRLDGHQLQVRYHVPAPGSGACIATAMFTFKNVPAGTAEVATVAERLPLAVASAN